MAAPASTPAKQRQQRLPEIYRLQTQVAADAHEFREQAPQLQDDAQYVQEQLTELLRDSSSVADGHIGQRLMELRTYWKDQVDRETQQKTLRDVRLLLQAQTTDYARKAGTSANELYRRGEMAQIRKRRKDWRDIKRTLQRMHAEHQSMRQLVVQSTQLQSAAAADAKCQQAARAEHACHELSGAACTANDACQLVSGTFCAPRREQTRLEKCDHFNDRVQASDAACRAQQSESTCRADCVWVPVASPFSAKPPAHACRAKLAEDFTWYWQHPSQLSLPLAQGSNMRGYHAQEQPVAYDFDAPDGGAAGRAIASQQNIGTSLEFWRKDSDGWRQVEQDQPLEIYLWEKKQLQQAPEAKFWFERHGDTFREVPDTASREPTASLYPSQLSKAAILELTPEQLAEEWASHPNHVVVRVPLVDHASTIAYRHAPGVAAAFTATPRGQRANTCEFVQNQCISRHGLHQGTYRPEAPDRLYASQVGSVRKERALQYLRQIYTSVPQQLDGYAEQPATPLRPGTTVSASGVDDEGANPTIPGDVGMDPVEFAAWKRVDLKAERERTPHEQQIHLRTDSVDDAKQELLDYLGFYAQVNIQGGARSSPQSRPEWFIVSSTPSADASTGRSSTPSAASPATAPATATATATESPARERVPIPIHLREKLRFTVKDALGNVLHSRQLALWKARQGEADSDAGDSASMLLEFEPLPSELCSSEQGAKAGAFEIGQYYKLSTKAPTHGPHEFRGSLKLRELIDVTFQPQSALCDAFRGIRPYVTAYEADVQHIQRVSGMTVQVAHQTGAEDDGTHATAQTSFLAAGTVPWSHLDEAPTALAPQRWQAWWDHDRDFHALQSELIEKGSTIEHHELGVELNGTDLTFQVRPEARHLLSDDAVQQLVPWVARRLGAVRGWDAFGSTTVSDIVKCPCFLLQPSASALASSALPSEPCPYKTHIYFRHRTTGRAERFLTAPPDDVQADHYDAYFMVLPAQQQQQQSSSSVPSSVPVQSALRSAAAAARAVTAAHSSIAGIASTSVAAAPLIEYIFRPGNRRAAGAEETQV